MANDLMKRRALLGGAVGMASFAAIPTWAQEGSTEFQAPVSSTVRNNVSSFQMPQWQDYFENTRGGAILADTSHALCIIGQRISRPTGSIPRPSLCPRN